MANYRQAPKLEHSKDKNKICNNFDQIPANVANAMFKKLGTKFRLYKIMHVLIGTKPGFAISEKFICERTGLDESNYRKARKELIEMGWITLLPSEVIRVNFEAILDEEIKIEEPVAAIPPIKPLVAPSAKPPFREQDILGGETDAEYEAHRQAYIHGIHW